jgi:hypothetical protein
MTHLDPNHQDGIDDIDKQGEGCLGAVIGVAIGIVLCAAILALQGCASMPGPPAATPMLAAQGTNPNCVFWCHVIITTAKAESDVQSEGTAPVTTGGQTIDLDSTMSSSKSTSVDPKP